MNIIRRNHIQIRGHGPQTLILAHGYGCDQNVWNRMIPELEKHSTLILFDHVGSGKSDLSYYNKVKYGTLHGYAEDVLEICESLQLEKPTFIGHSVSASIGALAAVKQPEAFQSLVMVAPSPSFINDQNYFGGFDRETIQGLLKSLDQNFAGWSHSMAPVILGAANPSELAHELAQSLCSLKPEIAQHFAHVTFLADIRSELQKLSVPTLILQCTMDALAPPEVGQFLHTAIPHNQLIQLKATGHCPHMSAPKELIQVIEGWLQNGFHESSRNLKVG